MLVPNSALSTNVFLQSKCNMYAWYGHVSWSWRSYIAQLEPNSGPGQLINYARFWPHRWTFAKNRTAHAQTRYRKSTQWQWASFVSVVVILMKTDWGTALPGLLLVWSWNLLCMLEMSFSFYISQKLRTFWSMFLCKSAFSSDMFTVPLYTLNVRTYFVMYGKRRPIYYGTITCTWRVQFSIYGGDKLWLPLLVNCVTEKKAW